MYLKVDVTSEYFAGVFGSFRYTFFKKIFLRGDGSVEEWES